MYSLLGRRAPVLIAVLLVAALAWGCGPRDPAVPGEDPAEMDTIVVAIRTDFYSLDPHSHHLREGMIRDIHQFDSLLQRDAATGLPVPAVATSWTALDDLTWEFALRQDVTFHNGDRLTAEDVKFSIERILDPAYASPQYGRLQPITKVTAVDTFTVRIETEEPWPLLLENMTYACILPMNHYLEVGTDEFAERAAIGSGPYQHVEWQRDQYLLMTRYDDHWRGVPQFKNVEWRTIPEMATSIAALKTGEIHLVRDVPPALIPELEAHPDTYVVMAPVLRTHRYFFDTRHWPMSDKSFRQAANYAVDWDLIIDEILDGYAGRLATNISPMAFGFNPNLEPYPYDPGRARDLLAQSGYLDNPVEVPFYSALAGAFRDVGEAAAAYLQEVGINVVIMDWEYGPAWTSLRNTGQLDPPGIWSGAWGYYSLFDAIGIMEPDFDSTLGLFGQWYWNDPVVDDLLEQTRRTVDRDERERIFHRIQEIAYEEAPQIFLFHQYEIIGVHKSVSVTARPDEFIWIMDARPQ